MYSVNQVRRILCNDNVEETRETCWQVDKRLRVGWKFCYPAKMQLKEISDGQFAFQTHFFAPPL